MQAMKCEVCGSNDIVKQDGYFVCQHCGTKYTVEEARKLVGTVKIDKTEENEKYLILAQRARNEDNVENAIKYYGLVSENDPYNWEGAFFVPYYQCQKGQDQLGNAMTNAVSTVISLTHNIPDAEKQTDAVNTVITYSKKIASELNNRGMHHILTSDKLGTDYANGGPVLINLASEIEKYFADNAILMKDVEEIRSLGEKYNNEVTSAYNERYNTEYKALMRQGEALRRESKGCYIATCIYGSYDCPEVWTLRRYRDNTLSTTWYGRTFIRIYYAISPKLVALFGNTSWFKRLWRGNLDRLVVQLRNKGFSDKPYTD